MKIGGKRSAERTKFVIYFIGEWVFWKKCMVISLSMKIYKFELLAYYIHLIVLKTLTKSIQINYLQERKWNQTFFQKILNNYKTFVFCVMFLSSKKVVNTGKIEFRTFFRAWTKTKSHGFLNIFIVRIYVPILRDQSYLFGTRAKL